MAVTDLPPFPTDPSDPPLAPDDAAQGTPTGPPTINVVFDFASPDTPILAEAGKHYEYAVSKVVYDESGLAVNVVQGPPGTPGDCVRVSAPSGRMVVRWVSKRRGAPPIVPSRDLRDPNAVYENGWIGMVVRSNLLDGTPCDAVCGQYNYALLVPYKETDQITIGAMPYSTEAAADNLLSPGQYDKDILGPNQPPAGAPDDPIDF